ncbi:MAG TPA: IS1595 family transposase [Humisphaera sp.]
MQAIPAACSDERAAYEFVERQRWGDCPNCPHCGSVAVYQMANTDGTGGRNKRFLWRCRDCKKQFTVRIGTVFEDSRLPLRHWCYAFWRASTSKKGVAALELMRQCQISYKSALFLLHRVRFAMAPDAATAPKLSGDVECDETYVGGKPRKGAGQPRPKRGRGTKKTPVFAMVQRGGGVRAQVMTTVNAKNIKAALAANVEPAARIITDSLPPYVPATVEFAAHESVNHGAGEYARGEIHTNTIEGFFSMIKRGIYGVYHNVSKEHLHRYLAEFEFRHNHRKSCDGERVTAAIQAAEGKRLVYRASVKQGELPLA